MIRAQLLRIDAGLSVNQLSEAAGVSRPSIARLEQTEEAGSYVVLAKLAAHFDVQPHELLTQVAPVEDAA